MSRSASSKGSKKGKRGSAKTPKKQIAELTEQNNLLTEEINSLRNENDTLKVKFETIVGKMFEVLPRKDFGVKNDKTAVDIPLDILLQMMGKLIVKKKLQEMSVEARAEDLETRVTQMSMEIAKMTKKTMAYEDGLQDLIKCDNIDDAHDRVYQLQLIAGQEYHHFSSHIQLNELQHKPVNSVPITNGVNDRPDSATRKSVENAIRFNLTPPARKYPGDTHIRYMHRDLRLYIMKELSQYKASGADWRMLAERVGIDPTTTEYWKSLRLECPMGRVFAEWGESPSASVRLLHRHLISPQMRNTLLGKRIADFYEVD